MSPMKRSKRQNRLGYKVWFWLVVLTLGLCAATAILWTRGWTSDRALVETAFQMAAVSAKDRRNDENCHCVDKIPQWSSQAGQDEYIWQRVLQPQKEDLCCRGKFVEFGARNGIEHSNTWAFEKYQGWTGMLFEVDEREHQALAQNRPYAEVITGGAVCPRGQTNVTILLSQIPGWTGSDTDFGAYGKLWRHAAVASICLCIVSIHSPFQLTL